MEVDTSRPIIRPMLVGSEMSATSDEMRRTSRILFCLQYAPIRSVDFFVMDVEELSFAFGKSFGVFAFAFGGFKLQIVDVFIDCIDISLVFSRFRVVAASP